MRGLARVQIAVVEARALERDAAALPIDFAVGDFRSYRVDQSGEAAKGERHESACR